MHFLCFQEAEADAENGDVLSFQLAQSDFSGRHLCNWVSELAQKITVLQPDALYGKLIAAMSEFLVKDYEWQQTTINNGD
jgi:hypothetical protein